MMETGKQISIVGAFALLLATSFSLLVMNPASQEARPMPSRSIASESQTIKYFFHYNTAELRPESEKEIAKLAELIKSKQSGHFEIHGFTDDIGSEPYNFKLSRKRANVILERLASLGVDYKKIGLYYHGEATENNETEDGRKNNRRIDFVYKEGRQ
jgi:outer membrane protein OmpA-like peptidoglycan-associated protein